MRATAALRSIGILMVGVSFGCGGSSSAPGASGNPVSLAQLPGAWAQTVCAQNFKCASQADIQAYMPDPPNTQSSCVTTNSMLLQVSAASVQDSQSHGRLAYDPAQEGTCLATLAHETCAEWTTGLAHDVSCPEAITPKVATGGTCASDFECIAGFCDGDDAAADPPKLGACKPSVAHGAACTFADTCVATDFCDGTTMTCVAKKPGGAACTSGDECGYGCNTDTNQCTGYAGCSVAPVTPRGTLLSVLALGLVCAFGARRRRSSLT